MSDNTFEVKEMIGAHPNANGTNGWVCDPPKRARDREIRRKTNTVPRMPFQDVTSARGQSRGFQRESRYASVAQREDLDQKSSGSRCNNDNNRWPLMPSLPDGLSRQRVGDEDEVAGFTLSQANRPPLETQPRPRLPQPASKSAPPLGSSTPISSTIKKRNARSIYQDHVPKTSEKNVRTMQSKDNSDRPDYSQVAARKKPRQSNQERIHDDSKLEVPDHPNSACDVLEVLSSPCQDDSSRQCSDQETVRVSLKASENEGPDDRQKNLLAADFIVPYGQIRFEAYHEAVLSTERATQEVFKSMRSALTDKKTVDDGYIYTLRLVDHPGYVKIGRTKNPIDKRIKQIQNCFTYELQVLNDRDRCRIPNHTRVERLIHAELRNYRQSFPCACGKKKHDGDEKDGMVQHGEWFKIDTEQANRTVARWRNWMGTQPYCDGVLRRGEWLRIESFHSDEKKMEMMKVNGKDEWQWDVFMGFTWYQFKRLEIHDLLYKERIRYSRLSVWNSLQKSWQTNLIMYGAVFSWSLTRSVLPLLGLKIAVLDTLVLGTGIMFYAALKDL